jgi:hypothetical protein
MGWLRKKAKQIGKAIKKVGKKIKKAFGKVAKAFGKLGPLGTIAMSFILPGIGGALTNWLGQFGAGVMKMLPKGMSTFISNVGNTIRAAAGGIKEGIGRVFNKITDGIEFGMNKLGSPFGKGDVGSNFRNWVSEKTGGFIDPSTKGVEDITIPGETKLVQGPEGPIKVEVPETTISKEAQLGIGGPEVPQTPKGMTDPVYVDGIDTDLKKGFYEKADLDKYYTGVDTAVDIGAGTSGDITMNVKSNIETELTDGTILKPVDSTTIKTTGDLKTPIAKGEGFFGKGKKTYKKLGPLSEFGSGIIQQEQAIAEGQRRQDAATREYFSDYGMNSLKYMGVDTLSAQPVSFFDKDAFSVSRNPMENFMKQIYNFEIPVNQDPIKVAMATNTYGYNFMDAIGLSE